MFNQSRAMSADFRVEKQRILGVGGSESRGYNGRTGSFLKTEPEKGDSFRSERVEEITSAGSFR